jgi:tetratricopeptide (TPR) repeat protein
MKEETLRLGLKIALMSVAIMAAVGGSFAAPKARKLTADAYLKTAKIEIGYVDTTRYPYASVMLDSLFLHYGPYAEGYFWIAKMQIDLNEKTGDLKKKQPFVAKAMVYLDSLHMVCADKNAKPNNKKGCDKFTAELDSIKVFYWRTFYNNGVEQLKQITEQANNLLTETDSTAIAEARKIITQNTDSCLDNMNLAITIDPKDSRAYIGVANAYEKQDSLERSTEWLGKGLERAVTPEERLPLVQQLAVSMGSASKFCEAATYFAEWVRLIPKDTGAVETMSNLAICLNGCEKYDSALAVQREILKLRPDYASALTGVARYFSEIAGWASDSAKAHETANDIDGSKKWLNIRGERYDSARAYLRQVFDMHPDSVTVADQYGLICASRGDYANAVIAFERVTRLNPDNIEAWTSLGDCYVYLKRFKDAVGPYEKVIETQPTNKAVLQQLKNLYHEQGNAAKEAEIDAKLRKI